LLSNLGLRDLNQLSHEFFEILHAMFAQRAFEIGWEGVSFVDVAAHLAHPTAFAVLGFLGWLRFGFYVFLVVVVCH
jgi:hypothetical protein